MCFFEWYGDHRDLHDRKHSFHTPRVPDLKPLEHWIGALQLVAQASGGDHSHSSAFDRLYLCLIRIEQSSAMIVFGPPDPVTGMDRQPNRKSTRLNSSH